jgi:hypothetical protein
MTIELSPAQGQRALALEIAASALKGVKRTGGLVTLSGPSADDIRTTAEWILAAEPDLGGLNLAGILTGTADDVAGQLRDILTEDAAKSHGSDHDNPSEEEKARYQRNFEAYEGNSEKEIDSEVLHPWSAGEIQEGAFIRFVTDDDQVAPLLEDFVVDEIGADGGLVRFSVTNRRTGEEETRSFPADESIYAVCGGCTLTNRLSAK